MPVLDQSLGQNEIDQVVHAIPDHKSEVEVLEGSMIWHSHLKINSIVLTRSTRECNFLEYKDYKIVYKR